MAKPQRSAEDVCVEYAIAMGEIRRLSKIIREHPCPDQRPFDNETGDGSASCIFEYRGEELAFDKMCDDCKVAQEALDDRKIARKRFGAAKRRIEAVGKRIQKL